MKIPWTKALWNPSFEMRETWGTRQQIFRVPADFEVQPFAASLVFVGEEWKQLANLFFSRLSSVFGNFEGLHVLSVNCLRAIAFL